MIIKAFPVIDLVATGKNIMRLRKESGLSVADLQEYFGFDAPQAIYKWQKGQSLPSTDNLLALGHLLDVTMEEILVTRPSTEDNMPQEKSCGSHRFGANVIKFTSNDMPSHQSDSILKKVKSDFFLRLCNNLPSTNLPTANQSIYYLVSD